MRRTALAAVLAIAAGAAAALAVGERWATGAVAPLPEWTRLPNGLQFRAQRLPHAKDVAIVTVFGVGSAHDPAGQAGIAHLAEHLYVTSAAGDTPSRTAHEWAARYGNACAAQTHPEFTSVAVVVPPDRLELELRDVAARMEDLRVESSDLERERPRVLEQITDAAEKGPVWGLAVRIAHQRLNSSAGVRDRRDEHEEVRSLSLDAVHGFARRFYCPSNARVAVAGDIHPAAAVALADRVFAGVPAGAPLRRPPRRAPQFGSVRIQRGAAPGPGYEPTLGVCVAYPLPTADTTDQLVLAAFGTWRSGLDGENLFVMPKYDVVAIGSVRGDTTADEVIRALDAHLEDFTSRGTGRAAAKQILDLMQSAREMSKYVRGLGIDWPRPDPDERSALQAAYELAVPGAELNDWRRVVALVEPLTNDDIRRSVAKWHVPERRIVVEYEGWRKPDPPDEETDEPAPSRTSPLATIAQVHVVLTWDEKTQTVHRRMGEREYPDDADLQKAIAAAHAAWVKRGKPDAPVTIDADSDVPWDAVIGVVNLVKRCGIDKIEFAMGAPPQKAK